MRTRLGQARADTFRYASIIHGGPGALINDGDNEINGILGTGADFTIPEPTGFMILAVGLAFLGAFSRRVNRASRDLGFTKAACCMAAGET